MELEDQHIVQGLQQGDRSSFETMFRTWYNPLCNFAYGFLGSREEAEESVQGVFIHFWEKRKDIQIDTSLKSYLYRSVRNSCMNILKHEKVKREHAKYALSQNGNLAESAAGNLMSSELELRIGEALAKLPEQCRLVFKMSRFEELKYAEIAERLGISIKTVENQMGKALRIMREQLQDYLPLIAILAYSGYWIWIDNRMIDCGMLMLSIL